MVAQAPPWFALPPPLYCVRMRRRRSGRSASDTPRRDPSPEESARIDAAYGLEPVFEPDAHAATAPDAGGTRFVTVHCPYCGEPFETQLDLSCGSADYIEDCQVCCQPIEFSVSVDAADRLERLRVRRGD